MESWVRPGIKPAASRILVGFITTEPHWELPSQWIFEHGIPWRCWWTMMMSNTRWPVVRRELRVKIWIRRHFPSFFFFVFLGPHLQHMDQELNRSCGCPPTPQPQQLRIRATSTTYTTAHSSAGSITHWASPGIEPVSSWMLVRFVSAEPQQELWGKYILYKLILSNMS